jgi:hypothetical protein
MQTCSRRNGTPQKTDLYTNKKVLNCIKDAADNCNVNLDGMVFKDMDETDFDKLAEVVSFAGIETYENMPFPARRSVVKSALDTFLFRNEKKQEVRGVAS